MFRVELDFHEVFSEFNLEMGRFENAVFDAVLKFRFNIKEFLDVKLY